MASNHPIPTHILRLSDKFRTHILKLESTINNPNSNTFSSSMTDTASSSFELREEDYINRTNPTDTINHLRRLATEMNSAGFLHECVHIYTSERSSAMAATFQKFKVQKLTKHNTRTLDWGSLESIIRDWNRSAIVCVKFLFVHEKKLCSQIFHGFQNSIDDDCFIKTVKESATLLFDVADALCSVHPSSEKFIRILELYQTLSTISPIVNDLFSSESIRVMPHKLLLKLAELIRRVLSDFEKDVVKEQSPILPVPEIHRLPRYVMNRVCKMCDYKQVLTELITSKPSTDEVLTEFGQTPLSQHLIWIMKLLLTKLEAKSKLYEESSMASFFMMINLHYIVKKIEGSPDLRDLIGDRYLKKLNHKLQKVKNTYLGFVFDKVLVCLQTEGLNESGFFSSSKAKKMKMAKRLDSFNDGFEKAQQDLANLVVPDSQLLDDVRNTVKELFIPAYVSFLGQLKDVAGSRKSSAEHIKYSVKDLEAAILNLFMNST